MLSSLLLVSWQFLSSFLKPLQAMRKASKDKPAKARFIFAYSSFMLNINEGACTRGAILLQVSLSITPFHFQKSKPFFCFQIPTALPKAAADKDRGDCPVV